MSDLTDQNIYGPAVEYRVITPEQRHTVALHCMTHGANNDERRELLDMLGLLDVKR